MSSMRIAFPLRRLQRLPAALDRTRIPRICQHQLRMSSQATGTASDGGSVVNAWVGHKGPGGFDLRSK